MTDAAELGLAGPNLTGASVSSAELARKRFELLKEAMPRMRRAAVLRVKDPKLIPAEVARLGDEGFDALVVRDGPAYARRYRDIAQMALAKGLGAAGSRAFAESGGLIGYSPHAPDLYRHAAVQIDRILKGAKPGEVPVLVPSNYELLVNLRTAKRLGLAVPESIVRRGGRLGGMR
jgi:putative ABC transport system substrate-binding protein